MLAKLLLGWFLMAVCVTIHAMGLTFAVRWMKTHVTGTGRTFWFATQILIRVAGWCVLLHLIEIVVWGLTYAWAGAMPNLSAAFYFSAVTYTTTGYGDLVLPEDWRLVGGIEALTGILMCGLSTSLFFALFARIFRMSDDRG